MKPSLYKLVCKQSPRWTRVLLNSTVLPSKFLTSHLVQLPNSKQQPKMLDSAKVKLSEMVGTAKEKVEDLTKNVKSMIDSSGIGKGGAETYDEHNIKPGTSSVYGMGSQSSMQRWKDKVAVVTGASSGIGEALARRLTKHGMIVVGAARRAEKLQELQKQCPEGRFHPFQADITKEQDIINLFKFVEEKFGRVDVLVNNAGVTRLVSVMDPSSEGMKTLFDLNVLAPCFCTREALRIMDDKGIKSGYILFTNSIHGHMLTQIDGKNPPLFHPYEATKHALRVLKEGLRMELRAKNSRIRVGEVSPGAVATEIGGSFANKDESDEATKKHEAAVHKLEGNADSMDPEEIVDAFIFMLQSPERSDITEIIIQHKNKE